ncbi:MAG: ATP-binding cassette domain-containing protein, partial [Rhizobiales bacterium]|nr:ATP-binding cassette domain-containing protein [Hyphomicrobiales bacterium]
AMTGKTPGAVRAQLGRFGFSGDKATTRVDKLSGGERARLALALITRDAPHLLILDEPTNHLDVDSREALIHAINDYEGAVILISHERHLIETCADTLWLVHGGTVKPFDGDMDDYTDLVLGRSRAIREPVKEAPTRAKAATPALKKKIFNIDLSIIKLRDKLEVLDRALADTSLYVQEPKKAADFAKLRLKLAADLETQETLWLEAHEAVP